MASLHANISPELKQEMTQWVRLGLFKNESEMVQVALRKMLAEQSREYLRDLAQRRGVSKKEMLKEWERIRG